MKIILEIGDRVGHTNTGFQEYTVTGFGNYTVNGLVSADGVYAILVDYSAEGESKHIALVKHLIALDDNGDSIGSPDASPEYYTLTHEIKATKL